ncbi:alpha-galactosidase [Aliiglaciecola sp.]|nr:alpha-galactosidase [Aliiglaciecola sp.]
MNKVFPEFIHLQGKNSSLMLAFGQGAPQVIYWGKSLSKSTTPQMLTTLRIRQEVPASPAREAKRSLTTTTGEGFTGNPGIKLFGDDAQWAVATVVNDINQLSPHHVVITNWDEARKIALVHTIILDHQADVFSVDTQVTNKGTSPVNLEWCTAATLPVPASADQILGFEGHWAGEFHEQHVKQFFGSYLRENRRGRTSHDAFPGLIMHTKTCDQQQGEAYGFHLGWSGNHRLLSEKMADGRAFVQMGELLYPGEMSLTTNQSYQSPKLYASYTNQGLSGLSRQFHQYVRRNLLKYSALAKPRPVHYNTWEGIYFDHDVATLKDLANRACELGVERFVLDDGWFIGRNDDKAGLGDWYVDEGIYPDGLTPVIDHVNQLGMEFGLWFEPEMVNPDSNLYRAHPDWILSTPPNQDVGFRNQLVLDLTRDEVFDYLFERLDSLLSEYNIAYIKWDMNRDINQPGDQHFKPAVHRQTRALYRLLAKVKASHPNVEIESCSSGGARADYGVLEHTDRVWTSDSNDALERLKIQKGFSYFFPAELMGSHVGPRDCHITHRNLSMSMRASVVLFGHMGMEMDLRELTDDEKVELKAMVDLYKQHRALIHSGDLYRLSLPDYAMGVGMIAPDKSEALFSYSLIRSHTAGLPDQFKFEGLAPETLYKLHIIWPIRAGDFWPKSSIFNFDTNLPEMDGQVFSGEALMNLGKQLPRLAPNSALIYHLVAVE